MNSRFDRIANRGNLSEEELRVKNDIDKTLEYIERLSFSIERKSRSIMSDLTKLGDIDTDFYEHVGDIAVEALLNVKTPLKSTKPIESTSRKRSEKPSSTKMRYTPKKLRENCPKIKFKHAAYLKQNEFRECQLDSCFCDTRKTSEDSFFLF
ncbi:hypothetical protein Ciccas_009265 [Cichlidogyrus casuarinus]|uniref:Uncharacterized protein n=1 Tax=Cichlidogyrus casuarinus TaxID=1844966 RepID=A0ABD2PXK6_9PLAT